MYKTVRRLQTLVLAAILTISAPTAAQAASAAVPETPVKPPYGYEQQRRINLQRIHVLCDGVQSFGE